MKRIKSNVLFLIIFSTCWFYFLNIFLIKIVYALDIENKNFPPVLLINPKNIYDNMESEKGYVALWELPLSSDLLDMLGLKKSSGVYSPQNINYVTQIVSNPTNMLQSNLELLLVDVESKNYNIKLITENLNKDQKVTFPNKSGEVSILGQTITGSEIADNTIDLVTKTTGDFVKDVLSGNGINLTGTVGKAVTPVISLGDLTTDWVQNQAHDVVLNNVDSQLKILGSDGEHFGIIDTGNVTSDVTYTLAGATGTLLTTGNYTGYVTEFIQKSSNLSDLTDVALSRTNLGLGTAATESANSFLKTANNLLEVADDAQARVNLGLGSIATHSTSDVLQVANNLSDLPDEITARTNLGLGSAATVSASTFLQVANNLSEVTDETTARANLGLGTIATESGSDFLQSSNNLNDLVDETAARTNLGLGTAATASVSDLLQVANNLSDLPNAAASRTNLGLGTIATRSANDFLQIVNNLSDLPDASSARTNLGLGSAATASATSFLRVVNDLSDINSAPARANLGLGSAAIKDATAFLNTSGNLSDIASPSTARSNLGLGNIATQAINSFFQVANNLSDLSSPTTARTNLGLGTMATETATNFLRVSNNLSDLSNISTGRTNLGLGTIATQAMDSVILTGGSINNISIGGSSPAAASFTSLASSGNTTLGSSGNITLGNSSGTFQLSSTGLTINSSGAVSGVTGYTQSSGNFTISGGGTLSTGTGPVSLNGAVSVASGKTLSVASADSLTVGGNIVPQTVTLVVPMTVSLLDQSVFIADASYQLSAVRCAFSVPAASGSIQITVDTGTGVPGSGTNQLQSTISLASTANTVVNGTLITSPTTLVAGNRLSIDLTGSLLSLLGTCTLTLKRV